MVTIKLHYRQIFFSTLSLHLDVFKNETYLIFFKKQ